MTSKPSQIMLSGYGHYLPERIVSNQELMQHKGLDLKERFIDRQIGIKQRHFAKPQQCCSELAEHAARAALDKAGIQASDLCCLIVATSTADYLSPATACVVQQRLGASGFPAFDLGAACSGFVYALEVGKRYLQADTGKYALVIGVDLRSRTLDYEDKRTAFLYGDGAGAVVIENSSPSTRGFIWSKLYADGQGNEAVSVRSVGSSDKSPLPINKLVMKDGRQVALSAIAGIKMLMEELLEQNRLDITDIDFFIFHQPNALLLQQALKVLAIPESKTLITFPETGNTVAASIPIALSCAADKKLIRKGDLVVLCAIGAGYTGGIHLLEWQAQ